MHALRVRLIDEWIKVLKDCSPVTWEAAILGDQKITELRNKGDALQKEKQEKLDQAQKQALDAKLLKEKTESEVKRFEKSASMMQMKTSELNKSRMATEDAKKAAEEAKLALKEVEERHKELVKKKSGIDENVASKKEEAESAMKQLREAQERAQALAQEAEDTQRKLAEEEAAQAKREKDLSSQVSKQEKNYRAQLEQLEAEQQERAQMEKRVQEAEASLVALDKKIRDSGIKANIEVSADVKSLRSFFVSRINDLKEEASKADVSKRRLNMAVSAFKSAAKKVSASPEDVTLEEQVSEVVVVDDLSDGGGSDSDVEVDEGLTARASELFAAVDKDGDGVLVYEEFLAGIENGSLDMDDDIKRQLYDAIDSDGDGVISKDEFMEYFQCYQDYMSDAFSAFMPSLPSASELEAAEWYYVDAAGDTAGPHSLDELNKLFASTAVNGSSIVWCEELDDWFAVSDVEGLWIGCHNDGTKNIHFSFSI